MINIHAVMTFFQRSAALRVLLKGVGFNCGAERAGKGPAVTIAPLHGERSHLQTTLSRPTFICFCVTDMCGMGWVISSNMWECYPVSF
jgi:hypothetical protein